MIDKIKMIIAYAREALPLVIGLVLVVPIAAIVSVVVALSTHNFLLGFFFFIIITAFSLAWILKRLRRVLPTREVDQGLE